VLWPLADHLGTVRDLSVFDDATDTTTVANHLVYNAFGRVTSETNTAVDHIFSYTGRELDPESDLLYYRARYYDPDVAKLLNEDPSGFGGGDANLARYVQNRATTATDPTGRELFAYDRASADQSVEWIAGETGVSAEAVLLPSGYYYIHIHKDDRGRMKSELSNWSYFSFSDYFYSAAASHTYNHYVYGDGAGGYDTAGCNISAAERRVVYDRQLADGTVTAVHQKALSSQPMGFGEAVGQGLTTSSKAIGNSSLKALGSTVSAGFWEPEDYWEVNELDRYIGYNVAAGWSRVSAEIGLGFATGGLSTMSKGGKAVQVVGKTALAFDIASNVGSAGCGGYDMFSTGEVTWSNGSQVVGGLLGLGGNYAGYRKGLDALGDGGRVSNAPEGTESIFKAPQPGKAQKQLTEGFDPADFSAGNKRAYFARQQELANEYARDYGEGVLEVEIPKGVYDARIRPHEVRYQGGPEIELPIPHKDFDVLNEAIRRLLDGS